MSSGNKDGVVFKFITRTAMALVCLGVVSFFLSGVAYYGFLNNKLWMYFSGYVLFIKYLAVIGIPMAYYLVRYLKSKELEDEVVGQSGKIKKDTEMLRRVSERGGMK